MADRAKKISELVTATSAVANDQLVIVANTSGVATTKKITVGNLFGNSAANVVIRSIATPANSTATNVAAGTLLYDSTYLYVATANNTLKRVLLSPF